MLFTDVSAVGPDVVLLWVSKTCLHLSVQDLVSFHEIQSHLPRDVH
jgi:hypothetical protein